MNLNPLATYVKERQGKRVIRKILISNNGMAAVKAILSMRRWTFIEFGSEQIITFVAMATQDDLNANAEFIRLADAFVEVPSGKNVNNYANVDLICKIAQEQQVDAVLLSWQIPPRRGPRNAFTGTTAPALARSASPGSPKGLEVVEALLKNFQMMVLGQTVVLQEGQDARLMDACRVQRISRQSLPEQQATRALLVEKVEQACAGWGCRLTDKGLQLLNQGLARLWPRVDEDRVLEDAEARIAQLRHFHREAAMSSSSFTELCARFPEVFLDYSVKALWEDDGLLAVHKPWGMRAYLARREGEQYRAWPEELTAHDLLRQICEGSRPRMCNRLDFATSGLMLVGKSREAAGKASRLFQQRRVLKTYLALVLGHPPASWEKGVVLNYRIMDTSGFGRKAVDPMMENTAGRTTENAETSVRVLKRGLWPPKPWQASFGGCGEGSPQEVTREPLPASLVEVSPKTGRRHQIRVHLAAAGHPVLGDDSYAGQPWGLRGGCHRMFLHSWKLELPWKDSVLSVEDPCDWCDGQLV
ncbi:ACC1 [Symbiodinium sp. CCMP2592]|nr:ACC1 [Symbiodinium sp. CCMP2592]